MEIKKTSRIDPQQRSEVVQQELKLLLECLFIHLISYITWQLTKKQSKFNPSGYDKLNQRKTRNAAKITKKKIKELVILYNILDVSYFIPVYFNFMQNVGLAMVIFYISVLQN